jgi:hypothetical protein
MKTTVHKLTSDYYLILQLYKLSKEAFSKKEPRLPFNDSRKHIAATAKPNTSMKNLLLHQLHAIAAPVLKRTAA